MDDRIAKLPKWARELLEAKDNEARLARSLRFTEFVREDLPPPSRTSNTLTKGCLSFLGNGSVTKACSSHISHGFGWEKTTSQKPQWLYSTRLLALRGLRNAVENRAAKELSDIDREIEKELNDANDDNSGT